MTTMEPEHSGALPPGAISPFPVRRASFALLADPPRQRLHHRRLLLPCVVTYGWLGLVGAPLGAAAIAGSTRGRPVSSGHFSAARQVGGATGLAVPGTVTWSTVAARQSGTSSADKEVLGPSP
jgi:hypothetical protein